MPSRHQIHSTKYLMIPKDVYFLLAKIYMNILTAVISGSGVMEDFYSLCILIFSNFSTMNMYFLHNKKKLIKREKEKKKNPSLVDCYLRVLP